jgi:hypothetical protein
MRLPDTKAIKGALTEIAEWLVACHGRRIVAVSLTLEGFYGPGEDYWGIVPFISRGAGETPETLPARAVQALSEEVFIRVFPNARFTKDCLLDVRDVARSRSVQSSAVSAHRRLVLLNRFGRPAER